ncbi:poly(glycerol-phosphate) alpha-glucosyltransferase [Oceaniferula spumae]|uniref:Poly(Glycerol-phosphate) alpha-glucosyltransferase n=1 Tax=Oceaniferula spumae TaxID=2979115 RepID=A0AAT9FP27_9BACT
MNCLHLTQSVSTLGGGISEVVRALSFAQTDAGLSTKVLSVRDQGDPISPWPNGSPRLLESRKFPGMQVIPGLNTAMDSSSPNVIHTHGLWTYLSVAVPRWAKRYGRPYVVSPHGMLDAWALNRSRTKKQLASILYERRHLAGAACLHALCQSEAESIRAYGVKVPVAIIPNGIDLPEQNECQGGVTRQSKTLLFLGRIHPKKGLANALRAWAKADRGDRDWQFVIAGWDQERHELELKQICDELSISYADIPATQLLHGKDDKYRSVSVVFTGSVFGDTKEELLRLADAFILPSYSEGLPMSVLEAWAYKLPVLMTEHCNLPEGFAAKAAVPIKTEIASIADAMVKLFSASDEELSQLGENGFNLVSERFTWHKIAEQMNELYHWVLGDSEKPECVQYD